MRERNGKEESLRESGNVKKYGNKTMTVSTMQWIKANINNIFKILINHVYFPYFHADEGRHKVHTKMFIMTWCKLGIRMIKYLDC